MAGIPWGKYGASDWVRVPGPQRRYRSKHNPDVTISRRQFDEHYGAAAKYGTYEKKAAKKASEPEALLRPARGRTSARKLSAAEKETELNKRRTKQAETKQQKLVKKLTAKKSRNPKTISLRNFKQGTQIKRYRTGVDAEEIEALRKAAAKSRIVFGYWVGLEMVSERDGQIKTPTLFSQRDIHEPFTQDDMENAIDFAEQKTMYAELTGMWIGFHLTRAAAIRNKAKIKPS